MSVQAISWVLDNSRSSGNDRCVLIALANRFDPKEPTRCWPGIATIASEANVSERTTQRCISHLVDLGELVVHKNAGGSENTRPDRRPNLYILPMTGCQGDAPRECDGVTDDAPRGDRTRANGVTTVTPDPTDDSDSDSLSRDLLLSLVVEKLVQAKREKSGTVGYGYRVTCQQNVEQEQGHLVDAWLDHDEHMNPDDLATAVANGESPPCATCADGVWLDRPDGLVRCPDCCGEAA